MQLAKLAGVSDAGLDHFYKVLRVCGQWSLLDEAREGRLFSANSATRQLVRGKDATLGHFVDHQVRRPPASCGIRDTKYLYSTQAHYFDSTGSSPYSQYI